MNLSALSSLASFAMPPWVKPVAIALAVAAWTGFWWFKGNEHGTQKLIEHIAKQAAEAVRIAQARERIVTVTETKWRERIRTIRVQGETIEKEVKVYVTQADDAGCVIPHGFVRSHDAAWAGAPAGPAAESDRGPSGIPLSEVAQATAGNASACLTYKAQRDGLIEFYRKQQAVR